MRIPYGFPQETKLFAKEVMRELARKMEELRAVLFSARNIMHYNHGTTWRALHSFEPERPGELQEASAEMIVKYEEVLAGDYGLMEAKIHELATKMNDVVVRGAFREIERVTAETDQVVVHKKGNNPVDSFIEVIQKIEFGVDESGQISRPHLVTGPNNPMLEALKVMTDEQKKKIEEITRVKEAAALAKERERKAKFPRNPPVNG
jgi:hypothetical protein